MPFRTAQIVHFEATTDRGKEVGVPSTLVSCTNSGSVQYCGIPRINTVQKSTDNNWGLGSNASNYVSHQLSFISYDLLIFTRDYLL